jgi:hypothetical protein
LPLTREGRLLIYRCTCRIYGLRLADCLKTGRLSKSGSTGRISVKLALVGKRARLGNGFFPAKFIEAGSVDHRMDLEDDIDKLTDEELEAMMDLATKEKIRAFVLEGREQLAPATSVTSPPVEEVAPTVEQAPSELAPAESNAEQMPPESALEGDADGWKSGSAA